MPLTDPQVTSATFWRAALLFACLDVGLALVLTWRVKPARYRQLRRAVFAAAALFWGVFSALLLWSFWEEYYRHFYPGLDALAAPALRAVLWGAGLGPVVAGPTPARPPRPELFMSSATHFQRYCWHTTVGYGKLCRTQDWYN